MEIVYPVGEGRKDTLRYSLRSLHKNVENVTRVTIIGHLPDYIDPSTVRHIKTLQNQDPFWNASKAVWEASQMSLLPESQGKFLYVSDDVYFMKPHTELFFKNAQVVRTRSARSYCDHLRLMNATYHDTYVRLCKAQLKLLTEWGINIDTTPWGQSHHPMWITQANLFDLLIKIPPSHPASAFKALYAALYHKAYRPEQDCKIMNANASIGSHVRIVSTSRATWRGRIGQDIRRAFPNPSIYERRGR